MRFTRTRDVGKWITTKFATIFQNAFVVGELEGKVGTYVSVDTFGWKKNKSEVRDVLNQAKDEPKFKFFVFGA